MFEPSEEDRELARKLIANGYKQISRKYKLLAKLPEGKTGLEALAECDPILAANMLNNVNEQAANHYMRVYCKDTQVELSPWEFNAFLKETGRNGYTPKEIEEITRQYTAEELEAIKNIIK